MAQLTIYLDETTQKMVEGAAARDAKSLSRWARECLRRAAQEKTGSLEGFYGAIHDDSFSEPEELPRSVDSARESFD